MGGVADVWNDNSAYTQISDVQPKLELEVIYILYADAYPLVCNIPGTSCPDRRFFRDIMQVSEVWTFVNNAK